jgi:hypothetical protein
MISDPLWLLFQVDSRRGRIEDARSKNIATPLRIAPSDHHEL